MLPLDVKSLFTNVPTKVALNYLDKMLREFQYSDVEVKEFANLTKISISQATFVFNDKYYKQSESSSMDYPLSPTLSAIHVHYFEDKLLNLLNFKCWLRYVDDIFVLIENPFDIDHVLQVAKSVDSHIQFMFEFEDSNTHPFHDALVIKCDYSFKTCVYREHFSVSSPPPRSLRSFC